jgi:hypothetical protein
MMTKLEQLKLERDKAEEAWCKIKDELDEAEEEFGKAHTAYILKLFRLNKKD